MGDTACQPGGRHLEEQPNLKAKENRHQRNGKEQYLIHSEWDCQLSRYQDPETEAAK